MIELLHFEPTSKRAANLFRALVEGARQVGLSLTETRAYRGDADWLVLWGPGAPDRLPVIAKHLARGGRVIAWDLAYWDRDRQARVAFDGPHPQRFVMTRERPASRWEALRVAVTNAWNPKGPILVAGIGPKAYQQYGGQVTAWETAQIAACRARWDRPVIYREKKELGRPPVGATAITSTAQPIDRALTGASLCVTWHSNVAVDAIRLGIPVICRDGAAAAVCPSTLDESDPQPLLPSLRDRFFRNLAWFQWAPTEATACWRFMQEVLA